MKQPACSMARPRLLWLWPLLALPVMLAPWTQAEMPYPCPESHPESPLMLRGPGIPEDTHTIAFEALPRIAAHHVIVSDVRARKGVNQHNYLINHLGQYWVMWSDGPGIEDQVGQRVKYATSPDGLVWSEARYMTPAPPGSDVDSPHYGTRTDQGMRYISRGFWVRDGAFLALASLDEAAGFFGPGLELHAFEYREEDDAWHGIGRVYADAINNFPPKRLPDGPWMMSRRSHDRAVSFLVGGEAAFDSWTSYPVVTYGESELKAEEPYWWVLPEGHLCALFRDNNKGGYLYRSFSVDSGQTWSGPVRTNFPDAASKFHGLRLGDGRYVLVSNAHPKQRDPLVLSISNDGLVFHAMGYLVGGRRVDYPHVIEHDGHLLVAFSGAKSTVELLRIPLESLSPLEGAPVP